MKLKDLLRAFDEFAPFSLQEDYDNSGIQFGDPLKEVTKGLICIDVTEALVTEAVSHGCDVIISHHPLIFKGIKSLTGNHYTERTLLAAIRNDVCIISVHTNLDCMKNGVSERLAIALGMENLQVLDVRKGLLLKLVTFCPTSHADEVRSAIFKAGAGQIGEYDCCSYNIEGTGTFRAGADANPSVGEIGKIHQEKEIRIETILPAWLQQNVVDAMTQAHPYEEVAYDLLPMLNTFNRIGFGMTGNLKEPLSESDFLSLLKSRLGSECIRHSPLTGKMIHKVSVCGGSGSVLRDKAMASGSDAFVTADVKYHDFFDAQGKILLADVGHYESEQFTKEILYDILTKKFSNFALLFSGQNTNPVSYF
jgi:dinuclear metal center YbgI/SA1388 family protein